VKSPDNSSLIAKIAVASAALDDAREVLHRAVREALDDGVTWSDVGDVLGVSRQAAFQRFGPKQAAHPDEGDTQVK
jgi:hypothetical protein